jgi:hypothetical protein
MEVLFGRCSRLTRNWMMLSREEEAAKLESWALVLEARSASAAQLEWSQASGDSGSELGDGDSINSLFLQSSV